MMQTALDLTDREIEDIKRWSACQDAEVAVRKTFDEFLRYLRRRQLLELPGKVEMDDSWRELDDAETKA